MHAQASLATGDLPFNSPPSVIASLVIESSPLAGGLQIRSHFRLVRKRLDERRPCLRFDEVGANHGYVAPLAPGRSAHAGAVAFGQMPWTDVVAIPRLIADACLEDDIVTVAFAAGPAEESPSEQVWVILCMTPCCTAMSATPRSRVSDAIEHVLRDDGRDRERTPTPGICAGVHAIAQDAMDAVTFPMLTSRCCGPGPAKRQGRAWRRNGFGLQPDQDGSCRAAQRALVHLSHHFGLGLIHLESA